MLKATLTPTPTPDGPGRYLTPPFMAELDGSVRAGFHVMLMGPRGTGKTTAVRLVARKFGKRLFTIQGHSDLTVEELRGVPGLHGGNSTFVPSPVVHAVREGAFLLLDEANLCRPGVTAWLNNILDQEGVLSIPETGDLLAVPADFRAFLCFNAGYQGTRQLNEALVDRCRVIYCKYWPEADEKKLLARRLPRLKTIDLDRMVRVANGVREARRKGSLDFDFSIRTLVQWGADADERTQDLFESFRSVVLPKVGDPLEYGPQHEALEELVKLLLK